MKKCISNPTTPDHDSLALYIDKLRSTRYTYKTNQHLKEENNISTMTDWRTTCGLKKTISNQTSELRNRDMHVQIIRLLSQSNQQYENVHLEILPLYCGNSFVIVTKKRSA